MTVAEPMHPDARDEIEFDTSVSQLDQGAVPQSAAEVRKVRRSTARLGQSLKQLAIVLDELWYRTVGPLQLTLCILQCFGQQSPRFGDSRVISKLFSNQSHVTVSHVQFFRA